MSISSILQGTINLMQIGQEIYQKVVLFMDAQEGFNTSGKDKKANVLLLIRDIIIEAGKNWDSWFEHISRFIDSAKSLYNSVKGII